MTHSIYRSLVLVAMALPVAAGATSYSATPADFAAVFTGAQAGDSITLHGAFGAVTLANKTFAVPLRIDASDATFSDTLLINNVQGVAFTGGYYGSTTRVTAYNKAVAIYASNNLSFTKAYVVGAQTGQGIAFVASNNISVTNSVFDGLDSGVSLGGVTGGILNNNRSIHSVSDGFDVANSHSVSVTNSMCSAGAPGAGSHPDCVQLRSIAGNAPQSDISILHNVALGPTQGFTSFNPADGGGLRIDISGNTVTTSYSQGVACYACVDSLFSNNTLTTLPGSQYRTAINIIGGSDNLIFANTTDGAPAPADPDPFTGGPPLSGLAEDLAWTPTGFGHNETLSAAGDAIANPLRSTVPEPATWAMLTIGYAALGRALRRRRAAEGLARAS